MECPHDHAKTLPQVIFLRSPFLLPAETACAGSSLKGNTARDGGVFRRHAARAFLLCRRNIFLFGNAERHTAPYLPAWKICRTCRGGSVDSLHKGWGGMPALTGRPQSVPRASPLPCRPLNSPGGELVCILRPLPCPALPLAMRSFTFPCPYLPCDLAFFAAAFSGKEKFHHDLCITQGHDTLSCNA